MIKECPVIINNDALSVVKFDDIDIQLPPLGKNTKNVNVSFDNGKYSIVKDIKTEKHVEEKTERKEIEKTIEFEKKQKKTIKKKRETAVE